jgi:hypothetical protein
LPLRKCGTNGYTSIVVATSGNYRSSEFYNAARAFDRREFNGKEIVPRLNKRLVDTVDENEAFISTYFHSLLAKRFASGSG